MSRVDQIAATLTLALPLVWWPAQPAVADACVIRLGPATSIQAIVGLSTGDLLAVSEYGPVYRMDPSGSRLDPVGDSDVGIGRVSALLELPDGSVLVGAEYGLSAIDVETWALGPYFGPEHTMQLYGRGAAVSQLSPLPDNRVLIGSARGLFVLEIAANRLSPVADSAFGRHAGVFALTQESWLLQGAGNLSIYDGSTAQIVAVNGDAASDIHAVEPAGDTLWYILGAEGLYRLQGRSLQSLLTSETHPELLRGGWFYGMRVLSSGDVLIAGDYGVFRYSPADRSASQLPMPEVVSVRRLLALPNGGALAIAIDGLFRIDASGANVETLGAFDISSEPAIQALTEGGWLVGTGDGAVLIDADATAATPVAAVGGRRATETVAAGSEAIFMRAGGLYGLDESTGTVTLIPGPDTGALTGAATLADGSVVLGAKAGVFRTVGSFDGLTATLENQQGLSGRAPDATPVETRWSLHENCASTADALAPVIIADNGDTGEAPRRIVPQRVAVEDGSAQIIANVAFPSAGQWTLQLVSTATGVDRPLGAPVTIPIDASIWDRLQRIWEWIAVAAGVAYIGVFALLFLIAGRRPWAFRILSDPVWSRIGVWPFFLIRHWRPAQCWVLSPWYQAMRNKPWPDTPFYDVPVTGPDGSTIEATALLGRLRTTPRLWLQGNTGMGKSTVFEQWERAYYDAGEGSLSAVVRTFGFILVTVPVRHFARLPADPNHPETWVVDAVQRRLQRFGMPIDNLDLVKAMLRAGGFALVFDGMNEADRDPSLAAFAHAFPKVPLLATSQNDGPGDFEIWRLPPDISSHMDRLLALWLGEAASAALAARIRRDEIGAFLRSGYDLRLVVELAGDDPDRAPLPTTRAGLYRAVLDRVRDAEKALPPVKKLAWTMVLDGRRELHRDEMVEAIGDQLLDALEAAHVVRLLAETYEFRHDQMRAFLAALWLVEETPSTAAIVKRLGDRRNDGRIWRCSRRDQEELWRFVADLLVTPEDRAALWAFALNDPERGFLQFALKARADAEGQVMATAPVAARTAPVD